MPLAIEPLHPMYAADRACVNTMAHANALCDELGAGLGIAVDAYHVWWDPDLEREIERAAQASPSRLLAYHICDWLVPTTDLLNDRGMMGDGVIDLPLHPLVDGAAGYRGMHEVEIFSANNWWKRDPDEVLVMVRRVTATQARGDRGGRTTTKRRNGHRRWCWCSSSCCFQARCSATTRA